MVLICISLMTSDTGLPFSCLLAYPLSRIVSQSALPILNWIVCLSVVEL